MKWKNGEKKAIKLEFKTTCREIFSMLRENNIEGILLNPEGPRKNKIAADNRRIYSIYPDYSLFQRNGDLLESEYTIATQTKNGKVRQRPFMKIEDKIDFIHLYESNLYQEFMDHINGEREASTNIVTRK